MNMKLTKQAQIERETYKLDDNIAYGEALAEYTADAYRYFKRYGQHKRYNDTATKNMLKALRMSPWHNSADDWARLHVTEALKHTKR